MSYRLAKINETLRHEIGNILNEISEEDWGIFYIISVQISGDLKNAKIWIDAKPEAVDEMNRKSSEIRSILRPRITFKNIPEIHFIKDDGQTSKVEELLEQIQ